MADCFISYSTKDEQMARFIHSELRRQNLSVFLASVSLGPGEDWSNRIRTELKTSSWVILLASRSACQSAYVLQESGMAMITDKKLIPIVWDISPSELPGWIDRSQALNFKDATIWEIKSHIFQIAQRIRQNKNQGAIIASAIILGILYFANKDK